MPTLDLTPSKLDLRLYIGDDPQLQLVFWTSTAKTERMDLSTYTSWAATIRSPANDTASFSVDTSQAADGVIVFNLEGNDVRDFPAKGNRWDARCVTPDGREVSLLSGRVILVRDVTV